MSDLVPTEDIERIVGAERHPSLHLARAVSAEQTVYILHSRQCFDSGEDLRDCDYSQALDNGIRVGEWRGYEDQPVVVEIEDGADLESMSYGALRLVPRLNGGNESGDDR